MKRIRWYDILILSLAVILQPFICQWMQINYTKPNIIFSLLIVVLIGKEKRNSLLLAGIIGLSYDFLYGKIIGLYTILFILLLLSIWVISKYTFRENVILLTLYGIVVSYIFSIIECIFIVGGSEFISNISLYSQNILYISLYNGLILFIISLFLFLKSKSTKSISVREGGYGKTI